MTKNTVFVVHGRNEEARKALFEFLRSVGLHPLEWSALVSAVGRGTPYIGAILNEAFSRAHAVVVLFTPDDEARLRQQFRIAADPPHEVDLTGQARQNVLFEAGMAMGRAPDRTIFVEMGALRPFSDIGGRYVVRLDNTTPQRQLLVHLLESVGCPVRTNSSDWLTAGDFDALQFQRSGIGSSSYQQRRGESSSRIWLHRWLARCQPKLDVPRTPTATRCGAGGRLRASRYSSGVRRLSIDRTPSTRHGRPGRFSGSHRREGPFGLGQGTKSTCGAEG